MISVCKDLVSVKRIALLTLTLAVALLCRREQPKGNEHRYTRLAELTGELRPATQFSASRHLCGMQDHVLFSCSTQAGKLISLCVTAQTGGVWKVDYRFGLPGRVELIFPDSPRDFIADFSITAYSRGLGCENQGLAFTNISFEKPTVVCSTPEACQTFRYTVFQQFESCSNREEAGVRVDRVKIDNSAETIGTFACSVVHHSALIAFQIGNRF